MTVRGTASSDNPISVTSITFTQNSHQLYSLSVGNDDDQYAGNAADDDDNREGQQRPLRVAYSLLCFLYTGHYFGGSDLQNPSTRREERLELFIDVQEFAV